MVVDGVVVGGGGWGRIGDGLVNGSIVFFSFFFFFFCVF